MTEDDEIGWIAAYVICDLCAYKYTAVYYSTSERLECPNCENMSMFEIIE